MMHLRHTYHTGRTARTLLILAMLCHMAITFSCSGNRTKDAMTENRRESLSADSLYEDPVAAKAMLDSMMKSTDDSLTYHYLMSYYLKPCAILRQYDSVTYYGGLINRFAESHRQIYEKDSVYRKMMENMFYTQGAMYSILRKADSALVYLRKAYGFSQKEYRIRILLAVGETYYRIGNYPRSVFHYREAMMLNDSLGQPINPYTISGGLAQTYLQSHDYDQAEKYLKLSINGYDSMDNIDKLFLLNSFGNLYYNKKEYAKALPFFAKADSMTKADKALASNMYIARMNMCEIYILLSMFDSAKVCLDEISPYFSSSGNEIYRYHLSTLKFALCSKEKDMQKVARMIRKMERTLNEGPEDLKTIRERYMRDYYAEAGLFDKAYRMEHHIAGKDDSLRNIAVQTSIANMTLQYQQDTLLLGQRNFIRIQNGNIERMRLYIWLCVLMVITVTCIGGSAIVIMKKQKEKMIAKHMENINRLRMENVRNCISPHFTFNVINRYMSKYSEDDPHRNDMMSLVKLLRRSLEVSSQTTVNLAEELDFVTTYVSLECNTWGADFRFEINCPESIDTATTQIPSMIIQIPVENAIKHGLRGTEGKKMLAIDIEDKENDTVITVRNNGTGYKPRLMSSGTGKGLKVIYQTIELLNIKNKNKIRFSISADNPENTGSEGTRVVISIPKSYNYHIS